MLNNLQKFNHLLTDENLANKNIGNGPPSLARLNKTNQFSRNKPTSLPIKEQLSMKKPSTTPTTVPQEERTQKKDNADDTKTNGTSSNGQVVTKSTKSDAENSNVVETNLSDNMTAKEVEKDGKSETNASENTNKVGESVENEDKKQLVEATAEPSQTNSEDKTDS